MNETPIFPFGQLTGPSAETTDSNPDCYIDQFPHSLPHRDTPQPLPCGHSACAPHTITYYGMRYGFHSPVIVRCPSPPAASTDRASRASGSRSPRNSHRRQERDASTTT